MCRSIGLPCVVVTGYALGTDADDVVWDEESAAQTRANHAWNEVYVDGRWIIVDTTWDCGNSYESGGVTKENGTSHIYFDANLKYFSVNHKILRYKDI
jgi:transglutaminase/protease-like cytokinesis protein 3